eukprot:scaffold5_cov331-Pavlova_lutheri.AAC.26
MCQCGNRGARDAMRGGSIHGEERGSPHATADGTPNVDRIAFPVASSSTGVFLVAKVGRCGQVSGCTRHVGRRSPLASGAAFATMSPPPLSCTWIPRHARLVRSFLPAL